MDRHRLPEDVEQELNLTYHESVAEMVGICDVVTINAPLHPETEGLFDDELLGQMKRGAYLINTARGEICDTDAIIRARVGPPGGVCGRRLVPAAAAGDHPWRSMPQHGMTPHISGSSLSAQARYAAGTREILESYLAGRPQRDEYLIIDAGDLAGAGALLLGRERDGGRKLGETGRVAEALCRSRRAVQRAPPPKRSVISPKLDPSSCIPR